MLLLARKKVFGGVFAKENPPKCTSNDFMLLVVSALYQDDGDNLRPGLEAKLREGRLV